MLVPGKLCSEQRVVRRSRLKISFSSDRTGGPRKGGTSSGAFSAERMPAAC